MTAVVKKGKTYMINAIKNVPIYFPPHQVTGNHLNIGNVSVYVLEHCNREVFMIEEKYAKEVCELALEAVSNLSKILKICKEKCSEEEYEKMKKCVGLSIGKIQIEILDSILKQYPELDDLN
jgi:hypothetical protein